MLNWYAIYVQSRHEKVIAFALRSKGFESCLPLSRIQQIKGRQKSVVELPVFPGYVFCKFNSQERTPILRTPGIVRIISFGKELIPLLPEEVSSLQLLEQAKVPVEPWPFLTKGQWVYISEGPLAGMSGIVNECKKGLRVIVSLALLQRSVAVEVSQWSIRPTQAPLMGVKAMPIPTLAGIALDMTT